MTGRDHTGQGRDGCSLESQSRPEGKVQVDRGWIPARQTLVGFSWGGRPGEPEDSDFA